MCCSLSPNSAHSWLSICCLLKWKLLRHLDAPCLLAPACSRRVSIAKDDRLEHAQWSCDRPEIGSAITIVEKL
jgi:hypothetical protein